VIADPTDQEHTTLTSLARTAVLEALAGAGRAMPVEFVRLASGETIVLEARGQSSVTGHGRQGLRPERIAFLRELDERFPVLLVFFEGATSRREAWLRDLGAATVVSKGEAGDPDSVRYGWSVQEMGKPAGRFELPPLVPERRVRAQAALI
jgi:hypothetical protein